MKVHRVKNVFHQPLINNNVAAGKFTLVLTVPMTFHPILRYFSRSISMVIDGKIFEKGFISKSKILKESTPTGQKILPKVPL